MKTVVTLLLLSHLQKENLQGNWFSLQLCSGSFVGLMMMMRMMVVVMMMMVMMMMMVVMMMKMRIMKISFIQDGSTLMHIAALNGHPETAMVGCQLIILITIIISFNISIINNIITIISIIPIIIIIISIIIISIIILFSTQILFKKGVPLLMPNKSGARGIHTAASKVIFHD